MWWVIILFSMQFDSLNVSFVGNWPFGPAPAVANDSARNLAFCGSGGGVYVVDVSNPASPLKVSEKIHTRNRIYGLFYDGSPDRLYTAAGEAGLEIWGVADSSNPIKLGYYDTPISAFGVYVSGSYAYVADGLAGLQIYKNLLIGLEEQEVGNREQETKLFQNRPNPFIQTTVISY